MPLVVIGLNHHTAPLDLIERANVDAQRLPKVLRELAGRPSIGEAVVLSTCNRTEVYVVAERFHGATEDITSVLADVCDVSLLDLAEHLTTRYDAPAVSHLFGVAAGADSVVIGESEILGQVKNAWERAQEEGTARAGLNLLFRHAVEVGKRVRRETSISRGTTSVSQAAVEMARERLGGLDGKRVLILGAGEMGAGMVNALAGAGVADVAVANRTARRAEELAEAVGGRAVRLGALGDALTDVDVLLTSTGASSLMLEHADLVPVMAARPERPLLVVDVAVPRDVDPAVAEIDNVTLLDMDDLRAFAQAGVEQRRRELNRVQGIVDAEVARFLDERTARAMDPLVKALRDKAEHVRSAELTRYRARLDSLDARQREAVEALTRGIVAKLLHEPTVRLKDVAGSHRGERLAEALRELFDL